MEKGDASMNFEIIGGTTLSGEIVTNSSKNGAVALLAASLLNEGTTTLKHVPKIEEVHRLIEVLRSIGVAVVWDGNNVIITPGNINLDAIDRGAALRTRSILMFIGPLLHHFSSFSLPQSGGCTLGLRSVRPHISALEKFGVSIEAQSDSFFITRGTLAPAEIILYESSDTGTINALYAAAKIPGETVIKYASANYQVQEVCGFLLLLGVTIEGIGTTTLRVRGNNTIKKDVSYTVAEDPIDAFFFITTAIVTKSEMTVRRVPIEFLEIELAILEKMGLRYKKENETVSHNGITKLVDIHVFPSSLTAFPEKIHARPYPGLNIDNLPFFAVIGTQAEGTTLIHDWVYEKRAIYYTELDRLGAETMLHDPHRISIIGPRRLKSAELVCPPALRPATILLIGMLGAEGVSILRNVYSINRGYEDIVKKLSGLGARISLLS